MNEEDDAKVKAAGEVVRAMLPGYAFVLLVTHFKGDTDRDILISANMEEKPMVHVLTRAANRIMMKVNTKRKFEPGKS